MDDSGKTPREQVLRRMSYSDLRKSAKHYGIKGNLKTEKLITSILEVATDEDSFVILERQIFNSTNQEQVEKFEDDKKIPSENLRRDTFIIETPLKKKEEKIEKFDTDKKMPSETPRRETYSLEGPTDLTALNEDSIFESASPILRKSPEVFENSPNVTLGRGSERKLQKRKVSFVTPIRRSVRISSLSSVKDRPKTPIPTRISSGKRCLSVVDEDKVTPLPFQTMGSIAIKSWSPAEYQNKSFKLSSGSKGNRPSTPMPLKQKSYRISSDKLGRGSSLIVSNIEDLKEEDETNKQEKENIEACESISEMFTEPLLSDDFQLKEELTKISAVSAPSSKVSKTPASTGKVKAATPAKRRTPGPILRTAKAVQVTPNFSRLHQKQFDKMESIEEYNKRKAASSAQKIKDSSRFHTPGASSKVKGFAKERVKQIPKAFGGIPFVPTVMSTKHLKMNFAGSALKSKSKISTRRGTPAIKFKSTIPVFKQELQAVKKNIPSIHESTPFKRKSKFDLKASLTRKLPYKPYTGPLRPICDARLNTTLLPSLSQTPAKTVKENKIATTKRANSREVLRGVRKNRRFELQMKNRKFSAN